MSGLPVDANQPRPPIDSFDVREHPLTNFLGIRQISLWHLNGAKLGFCVFIHGHSDMVVKMLHGLGSVETRVGWRMETRRNSLRTTHFVRATWPEPGHRFLDHHRTGHRIDCLYHRVQPPTPSEWTPVGHFWKQGSILVRNAMARHQRAARSTKSSRMGTCLADSLVKALLKEVQAGTGSSSGLLRRWALSPGQQDHELLCDQASTIFDHHVSRTRAVAATGCDVYLNHCEPIGNLFPEDPVPVTSIRALQSTQRLMWTSLNGPHAFQVVLASKILRDNVGGIDHVTNLDNERHQQPRHRREPTPVASGHATTLARSWNPPSHPSSLSELDMWKHGFKYGQRAFCARGLFHQLDQCRWDVNGSGHHQLLTWCPSAQLTRLTACCHCFLRHAVRRRYFT